MYVAFDFVLNTFACSQNLINNVLKFPFVYNVGRDPAKVVTSNSYSSSLCNPTVGFHTSTVQSLEPCTAQERELPVL